jgi:hypothetical protein
MTSIYLPDTPAPASLRVRSKQRTRVSTAASGKIQSRLYGGQSYAVTLVYNPMRRDQAAALIGYLHEMQGRHGIFRVKLPQLTGQAGQIIGNFINYAGDTKLHMITDLAPLVTVPLPRAGTVVDSQPVYIQCSLAGDVQQIELGRNGLIRLEIDLVERL